MFILHEATTPRPRHPALLHQACASCSPSSPLDNLPGVRSCYHQSSSNDGLVLEPIAVSKYHSDVAPTPNGHKRARNAVSVRGTQNTRDTNKNGKQMRVFTERARRSNMNCMLSSLQSLIPQIGSKLDKVTTVDRAIEYIRSLQNELRTLSKAKEKLQLTSPQEVNACLDATSWPQQASSPTGDATLLQDSGVFIDIFKSHVTITFNWSSGKQACMSSILQAMESHKLSIEHAYLRTNNDSTVYMIHAQATDNAVVSKESLLTTFEGLMVELSTVR